MMKATGIVRRIDDLGRIVIPKEIRRTMRIRNGDPLEIFVGSGEVVFKKYSPVMELKDVALRFAEALARDLGLPVAVCDTEQMVCVGGAAKAGMAEVVNSHALNDLMIARESFVATDNKKLLPFQNSEKAALIALPLVSAGDLLGALVVLEGNSVRRISETDVRMARMTASLISEQVE